MFRSFACNRPEILIHKNIVLNNFCFVYLRDADVIHVAVFFRCSFFFLYEQPTSKGHQNQSKSVGFDIHLGQVSVGSKYACSESGFLVRLVQHYLHAQYFHNYLPWPARCIPYNFLQKSIPNTDMSLYHHPNVYY